MTTTEPPASTTPKFSASPGSTRPAGIEVARKLADRQAVAGLRLARNLVGFDMKQALEASFREWKRLLDTPAAQAKVKRFLEERGREATERADEAAVRPGRRIGFRRGQRGEVLPGDHTPAQAFEHDADLVFSREMPARGAADVLDHLFCRGFVRR